MHSKTPPSTPNNFLSSYSIGRKLRSLRNEKRLTLSRLAFETGFSTALLSKLETDRMIPTLPTLAHLCRIYGVGLSYFFPNEKESSSAITRAARIFNRAAVHQGTTFTPLHVPTARGRLFARVLDLPPKLPSKVNESSSRTELFAYVLEGRLQMTISGSCELLETGDCVFLDSEGPAVWDAFGQSHCRVLVVSIRTGPE